MRDWWKRQPTIDRALYVIFAVAWIIMIIACCNFVIVASPSI